MTQEDETEKNNGPKRDCGELLSSVTMKGKKSILLQRGHRRRFLKGVLVLGATPYAFSGNVSAATDEELFDRLERQLAHFDDLLSTVDDALLVDYRREKLETLAHAVESSDAPDGQRKQLGSKVSAAINSNNRAGEHAVNGNEAESEEDQDATDGQLNSFINSVESQQGKKIDKSTGDEFIDLAMQARDARENPLVRADVIQDRNAPTSSAFISHLEDLFDGVRETVVKLENKGHEVTLEYFHEEGPVIDVNPLFSISLGFLGFAALGALKATAGIIGFKTLGAVGILTMGGWVATHHSTASQLAQRFYRYTPNFRLVATRYMLSQSYKQELQDMQEQIEGGDSALENALEELASRIIGGLLPNISADEAAVLVEYISELRNQFVDVTVVTHHICATIENEDHRSGFEHNHSHDCVGEKSEFAPDDEYVYSWVQLSDVPPGTTVSWTWTGPSGGIISELDMALPDPRDENMDLWNTFFVWMWVPIAGTDNADLKGDWEIEFSINGEFQFTDSLTLTS